jgi:energy-coupling factor transporter ATP-binding protein EcfA2
MKEKEEQPKESRAVRNSRVCYNCALPIHEKDIQVCPRCGGSDIDDRRARPWKHELREVVTLPHPWGKLSLKKGGTILLSGGPGSGKSTICTAAKPSMICSSEQEVEEVAAIWYRVNPDEKSPMLSSCTSWEELEDDLLGLGDGDLGIIDSISQLANGPGTSNIMRRSIARIRSVGAMAIFVTQYTKDGDMFGPNELRHLVDVVASIPDDPTGLRRLAVSKNRFGNLFSTYFSLTGKGVKEQEFKWAYSVEGPPGRYSLLLYPMSGGKFSGILEVLERAGKRVEGVASAAVASNIYRSGFVEPDDAEWRRLFAEEHGLKWLGPEEANEILRQQDEEGEK